jgi:transcriptional regulator with PAS, ATPase and Fis domain
VRIGRAPDADVVLADAKASRWHTEICQTATGLTAADLGSRNGTFVDGARIGRDPVRIRVGSVVRSGATVFVVVPDFRLFLQPRDPEGPLRGGPSLAAVRATIARIAPTSLPVLVLGETGTGKELAARMVHDASPRAQRPYLAVNSASIPANLVESELFGHVRGAFSGSDHAREGLFRTANGGTIFLDELGELPLELQARLLRVLDSGEVRPVGSDKSSKVDVRLVTATHRAIDRLVEQGRFRSDLYHRIAAATVSIPPLRDRREDIPGLARLFLGTASTGLTVLAVEKLCTWRWPGNVRELRNVVQVSEAAAHARESSEIDVRDLPELGGEPAAAGRNEPQTSDEAEALRKAAAEHRGNVSRIARALNLPRSSVYDALKRFGLDLSRYR